VKRLRTNFSFLSALDLLPADSTLAEVSMHARQRPYWFLNPSYLCIHNSCCRSCRRHCVATSIPCGTTRLYHYHSTKALRPYRSGCIANACLSTLSVMQVVKQLLRAEHLQARAECLKTSRKRIAIDRSVRSPIFSPSPPLLLVRLCIHRAAPLTAYAFLTAPPRVLGVGKRSATAPLRGMIQTFFLLASYKH
jgi:hypothetical protein